MLGATLLVAGTSIGGGILGLPVITAAGGFLPASLLFFLCWLFMAATGLLFVELFLWSQKETNIVSMAKMNLGRVGQVIAWLLYLFLFYSLTVAYLSVGGKLFYDFLDLVNFGIRPILGIFLFLLLAAPFVVVGADAVGKINVLFMGGLFVSFLIFIVLGAGEVKSSHLAHVDFSASLIALPLIFTAFAFQGTVPTLTNYLKRDIAKIRLAIVLGSGLSFLFYMTFEVVILGSLSIESLNEALRLGETAIYPFKQVVGKPWLVRVGEAFVFFAVITSFFGVTLGLFDFLSDGLKIKKDVRGRFLLALLVFGPPTLFSGLYPNLFLNALRWAGGIGCALLLGLLPIVMVAAGRYWHRFKGPYRLFGGRVLLLILTLFIVFELYQMIYNFFV